MTESLNDKIKKLEEECENLKETTNTDTIDNDDESLEWEDIHLRDFITVKFPPLSTTDEVNVASQFLTYLFTGRVSKHCNLRKLLFLTASFLRSPKDPRERILESPDTNNTSIFNNDFVYREESFLNHIPRDRFCFRESLIRIRRNGIICYASFLALIVLRVTVKSPESVLYYIQKKSTAKFNEFFPKYTLTGTVPEVPRCVTETFSESNLKTHPIFISLFSVVLATYKKKINDVVIRQFFLDLVLTHTCHHGLRLIRDYKTALDKLEADPELLEKCLTNDKTKESLGLLKDFDRKYDNNNDGNVLWPWARMLKDGYFSKFRSRKHLDLGLILVGLLEPFEGPGVWKSRFLSGLSEKDKAKAKMFSRGVAEIIGEEKNRTELNKLEKNFKKNSFSQARQADTTVAVMEASQ